MVKAGGYRSNLSMIIDQPDSLFVEHRAYVEDAKALKWSVGNELGFKDGGQGPS
jgi:hypothetical protein